MNPIRDLTRAVTMPFKALFVVGWWLYRSYGAGARETFAQWASSTRPNAADVLRRIMAMPASTVR
jgi:hypothetical protein